MITFWMGFMAGIGLLMLIEAAWMLWLFGNPNNAEDEPK